MEPETLLEELYAPNQFQVLVTCIFLNKTPAKRVGPILDRFLQDYPSPRSLRGVPVTDIKPYFETLGLPGRALWIKKMAEQLLVDPPRPNIMRRKGYRNAGYASEVAHLTGIGDYGSDAWRLFCKEGFYADHDIVVTDEWKRVQTTDKALQRYIDRKWREVDLAAQLTTLRISTGKEKQAAILIGTDPYTLFIPKKFLDKAKGHGINHKELGK